MLTVKELSYSFTDSGVGKKVLENISINVQAGEFVSIIGESGSGKSTLFGLISGLLQPEQGEIILNGKLTHHRLGKVGFMPQKDLLLPWRTVLDNITLPIEITKDNLEKKREEIRKWLLKFGLLDYENSYPHELSGGMRQRAAFLRTLMTGKNLLLLDEPFGALDSFTRRSMHEWLLGIWEDLNKTVLFITHDLEEAILLSDRIYVLKRDEKSCIEIKIRLPRPRGSEFIYTQEFLETRKSLERLLQ
ncbi:MAG: transporter ATP-binding protein [Bacillales bacterium]|jgi:putative hydroxymethylpyrimidine transport system ATP-binding protein|nr:transporter ATP-binding protein [Bacillales bacterium]